MIIAKILKDSINASGDRVTTFELEYPRYILAELNTHRVFSRNTASSRAIPLDRMISSILATNNVPMWTENKSGMQGEIITDMDKIRNADSVWFAARMSAIKYARQLSEIGIHKQNFNRLLEPFQTVKTVLTATDFDNFFKLRCNKDAMPEIRELAEKMRELYLSSNPQILKVGEWHLPYIDNTHEFDIETLKKISVSCCAQVSYRKLDTTPDNALSIYQKLVNGDIIHGSAFEHVCTPETDYTHHKGNLTGWHQFRHDIEAN